MLWFDLFLMNIIFKCPCIVKYMPINVQKDATIYSLFISVNRSTCFGWYLHPSSGAHVTVSTVSVISKTVTKPIPVQSRSRLVAVTALLMPVTVTWTPDDGWRYHPKHVQRFADINKMYIVASCWIVIDAYFTFLNQLNFLQLQVSRAV